MKKDQAQATQTRFATVAGDAATRLGLSELRDDGKLYHDEVGDAARWAQRLSLVGRWPHVPGGQGTAAIAGLRYEAWFAQGKHDDDMLLMLLCSEAEGLEALRAALAPAFRELIEGGKFARRYKPLEPLVEKFYPGVIGFGRRIPLQPAKAEAAVVQLIQDSLKPIDAVVETWDPAGDRAQNFQAAAADADPLAALRKKFGSGS